MSGDYRKMGNPINPAQNRGFLPSEHQHPSRPKLLHLFAQTFRDRCNVLLAKEGEQQQFVSSPWVPIKLRSNVHDLAGQQATKCHQLRLLFHDAVRVLRADS